MRKSRAGLIFFHLELIGLLDYYYPAHAPVKSPYLYLYIALYAIQIVSKLLYSDKQKKKIIDTNRIKLFCNAALKKAIVSFSSV